MRVFDPAGGCPWESLLGINVDEGKCISCYHTSSSHGHVMIMNHDCARWTFDENVIFLLKASVLTPESMSSRAASLGRIAYLPSVRTLSYKAKSFFFSAILMSRTVWNESWTISNELIMSYPSVASLALLPLHSEMRNHISSTYSAVVIVPIFYSGKADNSSRDILSFFLFCLRRSLPQANSLAKLKRCQKLPITWRIDPIQGW